VQLRSYDVFAGVNLVLIFVFSVLVYYPKFVAYKGSGHYKEFAIYAVVLMVLILLAWNALRNLRPPVWVLVLLQVGILLHFAGGYVYPDGLRLYDRFVLGVRFDKVVHLYNAFAISFLLDHLLPDFQPLSRHIRRAIVLLMVLGLGSFVEIVEYIVVRTVPGAGVGAYDNNLQDLIANLTGGLLFWVTRGVLSLPQIKRTQDRCST